MTVSRALPPQVFPVPPRGTAGSATDRSATQPRRGQAPCLGPDTAAAAQPLPCPSGDAEPAALSPPAGTRQCPSRCRRLCLSAGRPGRARRRRRDSASPAPPAGAMSGAPRGAGRAQAGPSGASVPGRGRGGAAGPRPGHGGGRAGGAPARAGKARARQAGPPPPPPRRARAAPGTAASSSRAPREAPPGPAAAVQFPGPPARLRRGVTRPRLTPALSPPPPRPRVFSPHSSLGAILHSTPCSQSARCPSLARARLPSPARAQPLGPPRALKGPGHGGARGRREGAAAGGRPAWGGSAVTREGTGTGTGPGQSRHPGRHQHRVAEGLHAAAPLLRAGRVQPGPHPHAAAGARLRAAPVWGPSPALGLPGRALGPARPWSGGCPVPGVL